MKIPLLAGLIFALSGCAQDQDLNPAGSESANHSAAIIGGETVPPSNPIFFSTVRIGPEGNENCTASVISHELALTAAHCIDPRHRGQIEFRPGLVLRFNPRESRALTGWRVHPEWVLGLRRRSGEPQLGGMGDIALVRFAGGVPAGYAPATLLSPGHQLQVGAAVTVAGYGSTEIPRSSRDELRFTQISVRSLPANSYEVHLEQRSRRGACRGDSGGPAFVNVDGRMQLWGVLSRATDWEDGIDYFCERTTVYTDLRAVGAWLKEATVSLLSD